MADRTPIEWTDATWTPIRARRHNQPGGPVTHVGWHCEKVSAGCDNCYAQGINLRLGTKLPFKPGHLAPRGEVEVFLDDRMLTAPLRWRRPRRIFVNSMTDTFGPFVTDAMLDEIFAIMALCPQHTFQVLTKRPERMREYVLGLNCDGARRFVIATAAEQIANNFPIWEGNGYRLWDGYAGKAWDVKVTSVLQGPQWPLPNVWLGTSIEDQPTADARIPHLLATPAAIRFASAEPLLGRLDLTEVGTIDSVRSAFPDLVQRLDLHMRPHTINGMQIEAVGSRFQATTYYQTPDHMGGFEVGSRYYPRLDWVIVGGESGPGARPMHPDMVRSVRDQCIAAGVAFFFKQWGEWGHALHMPGVEAVSAATAKTGHWAHPHRYRIHGGPENGQCFESLPEDHLMLRVGKKAAGRLLDGREWNEVPHA